MTDEIDEIMREALSAWCVHVLRNTGVSIDEARIHGGSDAIRYAIFKAGYEMRNTAWRTDTENAPKHADLDLYRPDAGVLFGQYTCCAEWITENDPDFDEYDEDYLWQMDFWSFDHFGACRLEGEERPTHWRLRPAPPEDK